VIGFIAFILVSLWLGLGYLGARAVYLDFLKYISIGGPPVALMVNAIALGPIGLMVSASMSSDGTMSEAFNFSVKSPNPRKLSYVPVLGQERQFQENLGEWNRVRKLLAFKPWDGVDEDKLTYTEQRIADRIREQELLEELDFELETRSDSNG